MRILLLMATLVLSLTAHAQTRVITDLQGRQVPVNTPVKRLFLMDARDILAVDIAAGKNNFGALSGRSDRAEPVSPGQKTAYLNALPELARLPVLRRGKDSLFPTESLTALSPDAVLARTDDYGLMKKTGLLSQLEAAGIPVVFINFGGELTTNTPKSITIIGDLFETGSRAQAFTDYYQHKLAVLRDRLPAQTPVVMIENNGRLSSGDSNAAGFAELVTQAGGYYQAVNQPDSALRNNPLFVVGEGDNPQPVQVNAGDISLGYGVQPDAARKVMAELTAGLVTDGNNAKTAPRVIILDKNLCEGPLNIFAVEALADFIRPEVFTAADLTSEMLSVHQRFTSISGEGTFFVTHQ